MIPGNIARYLEPLGSVWLYFDIGALRLSGQKIAFDRLSRRYARNFGVQVVH